VIFNQNARTAQNYNIIEDLAQPTCAMSTLEVLQNHPSQRRTLLLAIGAMDLKESNLITFHLDYFKERLSHHLAFQIQILCGEKNIHSNILDDRASTFVRSLSYWRAIGSPKLTVSPSTLKAFDGCGFQLHIILQDFVVTLKGNIVLIDIEVVDVPLDYSLLLGHSWFYMMNVIASSMFHILQFPHQGKIIIVNQLDYTTPYLHNATANNVPFIGQNSFESVGVGLLKDSSLVGVFSLPSHPTPQVSTLNMILNQVRQSLASSNPLVEYGRDEHSSFHVPI
jgi:hypothetical protein